MQENTSISSIYQSFLLSIQDYRIQALFRNAPNVGEELLQNFLKDAISHFEVCDKPLESIDFINDTFNCKLSIVEQNIIKDLMVLSWLNWSINDITQMNLSLNDNDFKHFSEEKNLKEKSEYADRLREKVSQDIMNYSLVRTPFDEWAVWNYGI